MSGRRGHHIKKGRFGWMELAEVVGVIACLAGFLVMFTTFMWLYLSAATCPLDFITLNIYNEADFEFLILLFLLPLALFAIVRWVSRMAMDKRGWIKTKK